MAAVLKGVSIGCYNEFTIFFVFLGNLKEPPIKWKVREQLILASAVQRSGDQNW